MYFSILQFMIIYTMISTKVPCDTVHWSGTSHHNLLDCFGLGAVPVLSVIVCPFY